MSTVSLLIVSNIQMPASISINHLGCRNQSNEIYLSQCTSLKHHKSQRRYQLDHLGCRDQGNEIHHSSSTTSTIKHHGVANIRAANIRAQSLLLFVTPIRIKSRTVQAEPFMRANSHPTHLKMPYRKLGSQIKQQPGTYRRAWCKHKRE